MKIRPLHLTLVPACLLASSCGGGGSSISRVSLKIAPSVAALAQEGVQGFSYAIESTGDTGVIWSCTGGSVTQTGSYKAPKADGAFNVTVKSVMDPSVTATALVAVGTSNGGAIEPLDLTLGIGEVWPVTAAFAGLADESASWHVTGGKVKETGAKAAEVTAPDSPGAIFLIARSRADKEKFGRKWIEVKLISVSVSPDGNTVPPSGSKTFTASVTGPKNTDVTWEATGGSISATGVWTAPAASGTYKVKAKSVANPKVSGEVTVFVS